jgi:hypothetical protein
MTHLLTVEEMRFKWACVEKSMSTRKCRARDKKCRRDEWAAGFFKLVPEVLRTGDLHTIGAVRFDGLSLKPIEKVETNKLQQGQGGEGRGV